MRRETEKEKQRQRKPEFESKMMEIGREASGERAGSKNMFVSTKSKT